MLCLVLNHLDTPEHFQHEVCVKFPWPYEHTFYVKHKTGFILFKLCLYKSPHGHQLCMQHVPAFS